MKQLVTLSAFCLLGSFASAQNRIIVDLSEQFLTVFNSQQQVVFQTAVITGSAKNPTPLGTFRIQSSHSSSKKLFVFPQGEQGQIYASNVWAVFHRDKLNSGYGIHDANWWPGWNGSQAYSLRVHNAGYGSHGCVNVPENVIWQLLPYLQVGTQVSIQK